MPGAVGESPSAAGSFAGGSTAPTTGSAPMNLNRQLDKNTTLVSSFTREQVRELLLVYAITFFYREYGRTVRSNTIASSSRRSV
jgi:hypothetical protein